MPGFPRLEPCRNEAVTGSDFRTGGLFEAMPQLGWLANADGWVSYYNRRWYEFTGTTPAEMEGWGWQSVHDPEMLDSVVERWNKIGRASCRERV